MMTENEHLLLCLAEECDEVGQRIMKALRFGLEEVQEGQSLNNKQRISEELFDLVAVATLCDRAGLLAGVEPNEKAIQRKRDKIAKFMAISRDQGVLSSV